MIEQTTLTNRVAVNSSTFITISPQHTYNLEVWEYADDGTKLHRMGRMDYKFRRDTFAGFLYRLFPDIDFIKIHALQKQINPFFDFEV